MMYSIVPDGIIFPDDSRKEARTEIISHKGQLVEVKDSDGRQTVNRLFSTEPGQYLQDCFQPGADFCQAKP